MKYSRLIPVAMFLLATSSPAGAALDLVDDFNGPTINFDEWNQVEQYIGIDDNNDNLVMANVGAAITRADLRDFSTSSLQVNVSVIDVGDDGGQAAAELTGAYYNQDSAIPTQRIGDVVGAIRVGDRGSGLEAWWEIRVLTDINDNSWSVHSGGSIIAPGTLGTGTPYTARIEYDGNQTFTFTVAGIGIVAAGPARVGPANLAKKSLWARTIAGLVGTVPYIHARFDDVTVGGALFDDFSSGPYFDSGKWDAYRSGRILSSRVDPTVIGKLLLSVGDENILQNGKITTRINRDGTPDRIEARVSVSGDSVLDPGLLGRIRLTGYIYNTRRDGGVVALPYDGCEDDVFAQVQIRVQNGVLWATAFAGPETFGCDTKETLISATFTRKIAYDTEYKLWIELNSGLLILGLDNEKYSHAIRTAIYPPNSKYRDLSVRIEGSSTSAPGGADGIFRALIDDVYIEQVAGSSSGGGCFIATAAYGSRLEPQVVTLRHFRDEYLLGNRPGRWLVEFYYRHSPPIADYIRDREALKAAVRAVLTPIVYAIEYPLAAFLLLLLPPLLLVRKRMRRAHG